VVQALPGNTGVASRLEATDGWVYKKSHGRARKEGPWECSTVCYRVSVGGSSDGWVLLAPHFAQRRSPSIACRCRNGWFAP
jgi:hypothetical protein